MQEALAMVRDELGPTAAVLHTREVGNSGLLRWIPGMRRIEVTAAVDVNVPSRFAGRTEPARTASAERQEAVLRTRASGNAAVTYEPSYATDAADRAGGGLGPGEEHRAGPRPAGA